MDSATYETKMAVVRELSKENHAKRMELYDKKAELDSDYDDGDAYLNNEKLLAIEAELHLLDREHIELIRQRRQLEKEFENGFDYVRPGPSLLNGLYPRVPIGTKDVAYKEVDGRTKIFCQAVGVIYGLVAVACAVLSLMYFSERVVIKPLHDIQPHMTPAHHASQFTAFLWFLAGFSFCITVALPAAVFRPHRLMSCRKFLLGSEMWNPASKVRGCIAYGITSIWAVFAPLLIVPIRAVSAVMGMVMYHFQRRNGYANDFSLACVVYYMDAYMRVVRAGVGIALISGSYLFLSS